MPGAPPPRMKLPDLRVPPVGAKPAIRPSRRDDMLRLPPTPTTAGDTETGEDFAWSREPGAHPSRVALSTGSVDLIRFVQYDHDFPRHSHDFLTIGIFGCGTGTIGYRGARWCSTPGSILAISPDEIHEAEPALEAGWSYHALYPSHQLLVAAGLPAGSAGPFFPTPILHDRTLARQLVAAHGLLWHGDDLGAAEEALITALHALLIRHSTTTDAGGGPRDCSRAVATARDYLEAHFARPVPLQQIAAECHLSPFHLLRVFRNALGLTPHAYLVQVRTHRARQMLLQGDSLSTIAYRCGFADQSHLTRTFKRIFGVTPGAYRSPSSTRPA